MELIASFDIGTVNLACCVIDNTEKIHYWNVFDISAPTNTLRCKKMVNLFDTVDIFKKVGIVLVEFQPSFNPKARVIEGFVSTYFIIRSIDNFKEIDVTGEIRDTKVIVYSPVHKLNCFKGNCPDYSYLKSEYSRRKKLSVFHTNEIIKINQDTWAVDLFKNSKKKDDLADSFLQAISYLRFHTNPGTIKIPKKRTYTKKKCFTGVIPVVVKEASPVVENLIKTDDQFET